MSHAGACYPVPELGPIATAARALILQYGSVSVGLHACTA